MLVDSHCHLDCLDLSKHYNQLENALKVALEHDIGQMLCVSITMENFPDVLSIAEQYPYIHASVGLHPNEYDGHEPTLEELITHAKHPKVVAIGETGLDYCHTIPSKRSLQHARFRRHVQAAHAANLPLIVHTRDAREDTIAILQEEHAEAVGGVLHCFTETWEMAKAGLDLGFYVSFSGIVTFKSASELREVAKKIPDDRILVETDAPYLAPVPKRGKPNEPAYVRHTAAFLAELRDMDYAAFCEMTTDNYFRLFKGAKQDDERQPLTN